MDVAKARFNLMHAKYARKISCCSMLPIWPVPKKPADRDPDPNLTRASPQSPTLHPLMCPQRESIRLQTLRYSSPTPRGTQPSRNSPASIKPFRIRTICQKPSDQYGAKGRPLQDPKRTLYTSTSPAHSSYSPDP